MFANDKKHKTKYIVVANFDVAILVLLALMILSGCTTGKTQSVPEIVSFAVTDEHHFDVDAEVLKVMTLNLGHGKGRGILQEFVSDNKTRENLNKVVELLERERPHVAAFQEGDIESRRSGNFNHVHYIAEHAGYGQTIHSEHIKGLGLNHGTALISKLQMSDPLSVTFDPVLPLPDKGFIVCSVEFGTKPTEVDVVSVHLDVASNSARGRQVRQMVDFLSGRENPLVVMGDFNCQLQDSEEVFNVLRDELSLSAYELYSEELQTFPLLNRRTDWILISPELKFHSYTVLEERVSDHLAVISELVNAKK
jgi:endonuclease/exonuclease/phosphatase family metal-dependent hydrolase